MHKKILSILVIFSLFMFIPSPANAESSIRYKSTSSQVIKKNKWTTLEFNGKKSIQGNGKRSLFCYQVGIDMSGKKKPSYIKIRLAREKSSGLDSTATNTYFIEYKPSSKFVGSNCWAILTKSPVVVQVRISGGSKTYNSDIRQFKMWTPDGDYPADFSDMIPETTV